jgi:hypothetical protein
MNPLPMGSCRYPHLGSLRYVKAPHAVLQAVPAGSEGLPARVASAGASDESAQPSHPAPDLAHGQPRGGHVQTVGQHHYHLLGHRCAGSGGGSWPADHARLEQPHGHYRQQAQQGQQEHTARTPGPLAWAGDAGEGIRGRVPQATTCAPRVMTITWSPSVDMHP